LPLTGTPRTAGSRLPPSSSPATQVLPSVGAAIARRYRAQHIELARAGHYALVGEPGWETAAAALVSWMDGAIASPMAAAVAFQ
jgi:hypothetical protein